MRLSIIALLLCAGAAVYILRGRRTATAAVGRRSEADRPDPGASGLNQVLAAQLARKTGVSQNRIFNVLEGEEEIDLWRQIDQVLEHVAVTFRRESVGGPHTAFIEIEYTDGSTVTVDYSVAWDQLPDSVRVEVLRSGTLECVRSWVAPWQRKVV